MTQSWRSWGAQLVAGVAMGGAIALGGGLSPIASFGDCALAQITPDDTLGTEGSRLTPNVQIQGASADSISGGAKRGSNLFHSFTRPIQLMEPVNRFIWIKFHQNR